MKTFQFGTAALLLATVAAVFPEPLPSQSRDRNVITRAELLKSPQASGDLLEAIRSLRPNFLSPLSTRTQGAGARTREKPVVYIDGSLAGDLDVLKGIMVNNVEEVRFKSATEAAIELSPAPPGGAIMVKLRKEPKP